MSTTNAITTLYELNTEKKRDKFINTFTVDCMENKFNKKKELFRLNQYQRTELNIHEYERSVKESIDDNSLFYFTFVGTQRDNPNCPEYYYDTYEGKNIDFEVLRCKGNLSFQFRIRSDNSLYTIMNRLFANDNIGVIIQNY